MVLRGSFLSREKMPVRSKRRRVPSVKPATARRPLGTRPMEVPVVRRCDVMCERWCNYSTQTHK